MSEGQPVEEVAQGEVAAHPHSGPRHRGRRAERAERLRHEPRRKERRPRCGEPPHERGADTVDARHASALGAGE
eukprot:scaffold125710_cov51-Phaeocystis_antarctica.AAC.1